MSSAAQTQGKPPVAVPHASKAPARFFSLEADYLIAPDAEPLALLDDFRVLFECGLEAIQTESDSFTGAQWAGLYAMRQAWGIFQHIEAQARATANQAAT